MDPLTGHVTSIGLVDLMFEDAAVVRDGPCDPSTPGGSRQLDVLPCTVTEAWLAAVPALDLETPGAGDLGEQASLLGLPRCLKTPAHFRVTEHQRVLEPASDHEREERRAA